MRSSKQREETHEIGELAMNVTEYLEGRLRHQNHRLTHDNFLGQIAETDYLVRLEGDLEGLSVHKDLRLHERIQEKHSQIRSGAQTSLNSTCRSTTQALLISRVANDRLEQLHPLFLL
jgi:hypothetical protein